jgi:hypothetical protein
MMRNETTTEFLERVENYSFNMNRHKEFVEHFQNYRSQIGVVDSLKMTLREMQLDDLLEN